MTWFLKLELWPNEIEISNAERCGESLIDVDFSDDDQRTPAMSFSIEEAVEFRSKFDAAIKAAQDFKQANVIRENMRQMGRPVVQIAAHLEAQEAANRKEGPHYHGHNEPPEPYEDVSKEQMIEKLKDWNRKEGEKCSDES